MNRCYITHLTAECRLSSVLRFRQCTPTVTLILSDGVSETANATARSHSGARLNLRALCHFTFSGDGLRIIVAGNMLHFPVHYQHSAGCLSCRRALPTGASWTTAWRCGQCASSTRSRVFGNPQTVCPEP